ncbi:hypothetical protein [Alkalicoccobacillus gibsonii]|uniref:hypothetical protein n=1 Tax=Alkalicoccobacillus gibsonii TaxID=79881 RepID=UPI001933EF2B|nr:hypothetical protein [Alkalicoccobacillus gibsonii]MBM0065946.1 hypothetical protein [Alkalicoccobacillus gibsonii]
MSELEEVFYKGMTYNDFVEAFTGKYHILEAYLNEESNQVLYVFLASDGFLGVLETPNEGLQKFERFQDMHDASQYFN